MRLRKGDEVIVISGKDKGKIGKIIKVLPAKDRVIVEGVAVAKRHTKPSQANPQGGIVDKEMPIHVSNVMAYDAKNKKGSRLGYRVDEDGKKVRILVSTGAEF
ncbi:50S ribosomal protein L24 [Peptococcus simiae]|uniref:Large ribosomal subunit protein uL24 n=1 Tax=Peptococcus simiae TaxID=1643805 RepID=A0ABW9GW40_9FIRM